MMSLKKKLRKKSEKRASSLRKRLSSVAARKRTDAEIWAEQFILQKFRKSDFAAEWKFRFRRFDFYFFKSKCALEIDGGYHEKTEQKNYDGVMDRFLIEKHNIKVFRVGNFDEITLKKHLEDIEKIHNSLGTYDSKKVIKFNKMTDKTIGQKVTNRKAFENKQKNSVFVPTIMLRKKANNIESV